MPLLVSLQSKTHAHPLHHSPLGWESCFSDRAAASALAWGSLPLLRGICHHSRRLLQCQAGCHRCLSDVGSCQLDARNVHHLRGFTKLVTILALETSLERLTSVKMAFFAKGSVLIWAQCDNQRGKGRYLEYISLCKCSSLLYRWDWRKAWIFERADCLSKFFW